MAQPTEITDFADMRVDVYRNVRDADMRGRDGLFMAESELVVRRLVQMPQRLHSLLLSREKYQRLAAEIATLPASVPVYVTDLKLMHEIVAFHIHRGVLAAGFRLRPDQLTIDAALGHLKCPPGATACPEGKSVPRGTAVTLVICEGITNVDNMGAIFRNAAAFGVAGIVLDPTSCDPLYRKAIRVSMGHALSIPYAVSTNWPSDLDRLKRAWGVTLMAAESRAGAKPLWDMPKADRTAILFGSEGQGLSAAALQCCDAICEIPMSRDVPSINVAVASAVVLYELNCKAARRARATTD
jgi:tRNA G18 (ribose-2'-O)-methylase SpoU